VRLQKAKARVRIVEVLYIKNGENGALSFMKLQHLLSFLHRYGSNSSFNSARVGQWKSV
jgi:hypothetical protein